MPMKRHTSIVRSGKTARKRSTHTRAPTNRVTIGLSHHILGDQVNGKASMITHTITRATAPATQPPPGDKVSFTSDAPDAEIRYRKYIGEPLPAKTQKGSPF